ncbi:MAG: GntR family transcriptional regulator [Kiritimatiellae bacterium]|nr:GntR family transcriptional regulator [Kiritimatiellia bacterium]
MNEHALSLANCGKINKNHAIPRYYQVNQILRKIIAGARKGDRLPTEKEMAKTFQVALLTLRRSLDDLVAQGIIEKKWGRGIFVKKPPAPERTLFGRIGMTVLQGNEFVNHPAQIELIRGICEILDKHDYRLELVVITPEMIRKGDYSGITRAGVLSGLIVTLQQIPEKDIAALRRQAPCSVLCNRFDHEDTVMFDYRAAMSSLTRYLLQLGHRRITLLNGPDYSGVSRVVAGEYEAAMAAARIPDGETLVLRAVRYSSEEGARLCRAAFGKKKHPTALIAADNFMAMGALDTLKKMGLRCPRDVSLAAFNDFPQLAAAEPPLTTVRQPFYEIGKELAGRILGMISGRQFHQKIVIRGKLIIRQSAARPG